MEYRPRMTREEFEKQEAELLNGVPLEFRSTLSGMAYDQGHAGGMDDVINVLSQLVYNLSPAIKDYAISVRRDTNEWRDHYPVN